MNKTAPYLTPTVGVLATDDDDVGWYAQIAQGAMEAHRLLRLVDDVRLDDKEINIAVRPGFATSVRAEQDHLGVRGSCSQAAARLGDQWVID
jgi:hypothetical protein